MGNKRDWSKVEEIVRKINEHGLSMSKGSQEFGIKVGVLYEYNKRLKRLNTLPDEKKKASVSSASPPSAGKSQSSSARINLPEEVQQIIITYRTEHPDHGYRKIEDLLRDQHFVVVSRKKIREVLKSHGLHKSCDTSFDKETLPKKGSGHFEADYPRELYQMDIMYVYLKDLPVSYLVSIIDDNSRFLVNSELRHDQKGQSMIEVVHRAVDRYGKPKKLLTDQGGSFYTWSQNQTIFQNYLDDMKIDHLVSDPHSPQTLGKLERWHQTIQRELLRKTSFTSYAHARQGIADWINSYNYHRSHQGINGSCPADRFHGIEGETVRLESELLDKSLDLSKGYLIFKSSNHSICVGYTSQGVRLFLNGKLLSQRQD